MLYFLFNIIKKLVNPLKHGLPSLYCALYDRSHKWIFTRYVFSYLIGISLAVLFWDIFIRNLEFSLDFTYASLTLLIIIFGLGFVFTSAIKCIALLACCGLVGKSGRSFLRALCVAYIISGPITNLAMNGQEIVRVFTCTTILTYNLTKTRFDLMTKPFQNALAAMKGEMTEIRSNFESIEEVLKPIKEEIEGDFSDENSTGPYPIVERYLRQNILSTLSFSDPTNKTAKIAQAKSCREKYNNKMRLRCKEQLQKGENRCKNAFSNAHDKCMDKLPVIVDVLLCWPLKIDYICNMKLLGYKETGGICEPGDAIDPKLGENIVDLKETEYNLFENATDVQVSYEIVEIKQPPQLKAAKETAKVVVEQFNKKKMVFDYVISIMQKILSFVFLRVIHSSTAYRKSYMRLIDYDNLYITPYFKKIDERRKEANQHILLPLKKFEQKLLVDTDKFEQKTKEENRASTFLYLQFFLELLISGFFLMLDHMVVVLLQIIASKSEITYYQEGEHIINLHIKGSGLMARLMRKTLQNFNMHERISTVLSNSQCLPNPSILPRRFYITLLGMYIATLALIHYSSLTLRSRRFICSYFYQKREKQRILHLYNKMLKQRRSLFESMCLKLQKDMESRRLKMKFNLFLWLRLRHSKRFGWLRWFQIARRKCLICEEPEPRNPNSPTAIKFIECNTSNCKFVHCEECWLDVGEVCMACGSEEITIHYCTSRSSI